MSGNIYEYVVGGPRPTSYIACINPIGLSEAILGAEVRVPTLEGAVLLNVPPGVSTGTRLRIGGKGVGRSGRSGQSKGDLYVILKVVTPPAVDSEFKSALENWSKRQHFDPRAGWRGSRGGEWS